MVEISDEATLYTPEEAKRVGIKIKGDEAVEEICPVCKQGPLRLRRGSVPTEAVAVRLQGQGEEGLRRRHAGAGVPGHRRPVPRPRRQVAQPALHPHRGHGQGRGEGRAVPGPGDPADRQGCSSRWTSGWCWSSAASEKFSVEFKGSWDRYKRIKQVTDALSQEASNASVRMGVRADFEGGLAPDGDQFQTIRDVLVSLGMGKVFVDGQPGAEAGEKRERGEREKGRGGAGEKGSGGEGEKGSGEKGSGGRGEGEQGRRGEGEQGRRGERGTG